MTANNVQTKEEFVEPTTENIQGFWTERPMIHPGYGFDIDQATPQQVFDHMERIMRDKGALFQDEGAPLMSKYIDYDSLKGKKALEIGYGTGWLTNELAKVCESVDGVDLSHAHYELSTLRFSDQDHVSLQICSAEELPFEDNSFDFVASYGVIHHAESDVNCYNEVLRVLKPGGRCFLMLYRAGGPKYWWQKIIRKGLLKGQLQKHNWNIKRFINSVTDAYQEDSPGAPISRHYTRQDIKRLFKDFSDLEIMISGNRNEWNDLPLERLPLSNIIPRKWRDHLVQLSGAYWMIRLEK